MAERIADWWRRRQFSRERDVPYEIGTYREAWATYPMLIRQYHPDLNEGITLTQIPPAADVLLRWQCEAGHIFPATPAEQRSRPGRERRRSAWCPDCSDLAVPRKTAPRRPRPGRPVCEKTPDLPTGEAFVSACAPRPASAVEARVRADVFETLAVTPGRNAIRVGRPFFDHVEVWPDILLPELRVAIEYDSTGRHGLEHVGQREAVDRRKDRMLRGAGWEVIRLRTGKLEALGAHDLVIASWNRRALARLLDALRDIRGSFVVDAYALDRPVLPRARGTPS